MGRETPAGHGCAVGGLLVACRHLAFCWLARSLPLLHFSFRPAEGKQRRRCLLLRTYPALSLPAAFCALRVRHASVSGVQAGRQAEGGPLFSTVAVRCLLPYTFSTEDIRRGITHSANYVSLR